MGNYKWANTMQIQYRKQILNVRYLHKISETHEVNKNVVSWSKYTPRINIDSETLKIWIYIYYIYTREETIYIVKVVLP